MCYNYAVDLLASFKYMKKILALIVPIFVFVPISVFGQTMVSNGADRAGLAGQDSQPVIIADVSINDFQYSYDESTRKIKVSFAFTNGSQPINDVNYALSIVADNGAEKDYVYDENIYLSANASSPQAIEVSVPSYIYGNSKIVLQAKTASGMPLVTRMREGVVIKKIADILYLNSQSCYLTVSGTTKYDLNQGVDIDPTEKLFLNCIVVNSAKRSYTLSPNIKTYERSLQGPSMGESKLLEVTIKNATSTVKIAVTVPTKPQAYSSIVTVLNGSDPIGEVGFHYVIRGESGTLNRVQLDKKSYLAGDTASVKILWSPRADAFPGARASTTVATGTLLGTISISRDGVRCAETTSFSPSIVEEQSLVVNVPMRTDCNGFTTKVTVTNPVNNVIVADTSFDTPRDTSQDVINGGSENAGADRYLSVVRVLVTLVFFALIILMILLIKKKRKQIDPKVLLFLIIIVSAFSTVQIVRASYIGAMIQSGGRIFPVYASADFEIFKAGRSTSATSGYQVGDTITITDYESATHLRCSNGAYISVLSRATVRGPNGRNILSESYLQSTNPFLPYWGTSSRTRNVTINAPGTYTVTVYFKLMDWNISGVLNGQGETSFTKTFTVAEAVAPKLTVHFAGNHIGSVMVNTAPNSAYTQYSEITLNNPSIWTTVTCTGPSPCSYTLVPNTQVMIVPTAVSMSNFQGWSGACTGNSVPCSILFGTTARDVTVNFDGGGGDGQSISVDLNANPTSVVASLTANSSLTWTSVGATSCTTSGDWASNGVAKTGVVTTANTNPGFITGPLSVAGKVYTYNITCSNGSKQATDTVTVQAISPSASLALTCSADETEVPLAGDYVTFTATLPPGIPDGSFYWNGATVSESSRWKSITIFYTPNATPPQTQTFTVKDSGSPQKSGSVTCDSIPATGGPPTNTSPNKPAVTGLVPCINDGSPFTIQVNSSDAENDDIYYNVHDANSGADTRYPPLGLTEQGRNYPITLHLSGIGQHNLQITAIDSRGLISDPYEANVNVAASCSGINPGNGGPLKLLINRAIKPLNDNSDDTTDLVGPLEGPPQYYANPNKSEVRRRGQSFYFLENIKTPSTFDECRRTITPFLTVIENSLDDWKALTLITTATVVPIKLTTTADTLLGQYIFKTTCSTVGKLDVISSVKLNITSSGIQER